MQALSIALAEFPDVNATLQSDMRAIVRHRHHNIGVAIATPTGLVVNSFSNAPSPVPCLSPVSVPAWAGQLALPSAIASHGHTLEMANGFCCRGVYIQHPQAGCA